MLIAGLEARSFRSLSTFEAKLAPGITTILGPNGAGKTNLLEAMFFALTGRSFRTGDRRELIAFGEPVARAAATLEGEDGAEHILLASVSRGEGRRHLLDGAATAPADSARLRPHVTVFSPDLLALVKGPPGERRAHLDAFTAVRWPARADLRRGYGQVLAQRNALLGRVAAGLVGEPELDAWDRTLADAAEALIAARRAAIAELAAPFAQAAADLGLADDAELGYAPRADGGAEAIADELRSRRESELQSGRTTYGPHLDEVALKRAGRPLRRYGSQGEQRAALLALLFAEREALLAAAAPPPLMLLDDVMSELDPEHRELLVSRLEGQGQSLITAADEGAVPAAARRSVIRLGSAAGSSLSAAA
jgi:DNA replication and repair protein RecF